MPFGVRDRRFSDTADLAMYRHGRSSFLRSWALAATMEFLKDGVVEYLVKPVEKAKLIEAVTKAARQHRIFSGDKCRI